MRTVLRIAGALLGIGAALLALYLPIMAWLTWVDAEADWTKAHPLSFWHTLALWGTMLILMALPGGIAYAFLRYAFRRPRQNELTNAR